MSSSEKSEFFKLLVLVNGVVPAAMLMWDVWRGNTGANAISYALHTTGFLSLIFLALTLCITPLRRFTGSGLWLAGRRTLGLYAFFYSLAHVIIYVLFDRAGNISSTINELGLRTYLQVGMAAFCAMVPLAVTSTDAMVKRLGAVRWKLLHRLTYVAAICGAAHYGLAVKADIAWPMVFVAVFTVLIAMRLLPIGSDHAASSSWNRSRHRDPAKLMPPWKGLLQVEKIIDETDDVRTIRLVHPELSELPFHYLPGQFMTVHCMIDGRRVPRSYTIASGNACRTACDITVKKLPGGTVSSFLHEKLEVGHSLLVTAPLGRFCFSGGNVPGVLLIAGGVGITPLMSMVRSLREAAWTGEIRLLFAVKTKRDVIYATELGELSASNPRFKLHITLSRHAGDDDWNGTVGRIDMKMIETFTAGATHYPVFMCGPNEMMNDVRLLLLNSGVSISQIATEEFASPKPMPRSIGGQAAGGEQTNGSIAGNMLRMEWKSGGAVIAADSDKTVLEAFEDAGHYLPFECRAGVCGQCRCRLLEGQVAMDSDEALSDGEKSDGWILACQARPLDDLVIE